MEKKIDENKISSFNKKVWDEEDLVKDYFEQSHLQKPEETIVNIFKERFKDMNMLDIGVGGGRTTVHFSGLVKNYIGIDYSDKMIEACRKRFPDHDAVDFQRCDVRSMEIYEDNHFDFILFSYNGIDYISPSDRIKALLEIKRINKKEGFFCFSTHNFQYIDKLFEIRFSTNIKTMLRMLLRYLRFRFYNNNHKTTKNEKYAVIRDGGCEFRLETYYITPLEQIKQLEEIGFKNIRVFSLESGREITDKSRLENMADDCWLYYLSNA